MPIKRLKLTPEPPTFDKRGFNIHSAAEYLGLSKFRLYELVKTGKLHAVRTGHGHIPALLFDRIDLDRYMDGLFGRR